MAIQMVSVNVLASGTVVPANGRASADLVTLAATVTADVAAAQVVGAGDAHAEVDTLDTDYQVLVKAIANVGHFTVYFNDAAVLTRKAFMAAAEKAAILTGLK